MAGHLLCAYCVLGFQSWKVLLTALTLKLPTFQLCEWDPCSEEACAGPKEAAHQAGRAPFAGFPHLSFLEACCLLLPSYIQVVAVQLEGKENLNGVQREGML